MRQVLRKIPGAVNRVRTVRGRLGEAEAFIELLCFCHRRQGVEDNLAISDRCGFLQDPGHERTAETSSSSARSYVETFHLAAIGGDGLQGHATCSDPGFDREQQASVGRRV